MSTDDITRESIDDGSQDCIVCPLHRTAFALDTGEVVGEWCPYPPFLGNMMGTVKKKNDLTTLQMRTRGKNIEIKILSSKKLLDIEPAYSNAMLKVLILIIDLSAK